MADNNLEITYIPYGLDEISQLDLMTNLANGVEGYLGSKRWARKDKYRNAWLAAYLDIIGRGLTGASNDSGIWTINHNGEAIPLDTKSEIEKEMYQDAAYYIQLQMAKMTPRKKEEEKKKEDLTPFKFKESFTQLLLNNRFGGDSSLFGNTEQGWNTLDARDEKTGLRGTEKRREAMAAELESYLKTIEDGKFNFEGTSFKDENDARTKILAAINALRDTPNDESDDIPAFSALGLNYRGFFSNGGNEASTHINPATNTPFTYSEWNLYQLQLAEAKAKEEAEKAKALRAAQYDGYDIFDLSQYNGRPLTAEESNIEHLNNIISKKKWTGDEASQIKYAFKLAEKNGALTTLSKEDEALFSPIWKGRVKHLRKIKDINGLYYDTISGKYLRPYKKEQTPQTSFLDILNLNNPEAIAKRKQEVLQKALDNYLNSTEGGFTPLERNEVIALLFDLGAAVDPEGISSAGLSLVASTFRDYNRATDPEGWTLGDTGWATLDHGLGLLSLIPVAGGWVKGAWAAKKLGSYIPKMEKWIRLAGRAGSTYAMTTNASGALNTLNKIKNGEDLSLKDYQDLAYFFIGGLGHHQLNRSNRTARSAMKARGIETSNSILNKAGITRTKAKVNTTETTPTLKVKKTGEDGKIETKEIPIKKELLEILKGTKPKELDAKVKELQIDVPEGYKVDVPTTSWKSGKYNEIKAKLGYGNKEIFGTQTKQNQTSPLKSNEEFEQYLSEHNNNWFKKFVNGSNRDIRRYDRNYLNSNPQENTSLETKKTSPSITKKETPLTPELATELKQNVKSWRQEHKDILNIRKNKGRNYEWSKNDVGTNPDKLKSSIKLGDKELNIEIASDGILIINGEKTSINGFGKSGKQEVRKKIKEIVLLTTKQQRLKRNTEEFKKLVQELKKLKSSGFLKQGGQINPSLDTIIEDFIKNNNI